MNTRYIKLTALSASLLLPLALVLLLLIPMMAAQQAKLVPRNEGTALPAPHRSFSVR